MSDRRLAELLQRVLTGRGAVLQALYPVCHAEPWYRDCVEEQVALRVLVERLRAAPKAKPHKPLDR